MNNKGEAESGTNALWDNALYFILVGLFVVLMFAFVQQQRSGGVIWEDYYAKELVKVIDASQAGDTVSLNVQPALRVAKHNKFTDYNRIFNFNSKDNQVCVQLSSGIRSTCFYYHTAVAVTDINLKFNILFLLISLLLHNAH